MSLSEDYMVTFQRFCTVMNDKVVDQIVSMKLQLSNQTMLDFLITTARNDYQLLGLSFLIERLATGDQALVNDCPNIESFRNG